MSLSCFIERAVPEHSSGCIHPAAIASLRDLRLRGHRRSTGECAGDLTPPDDVDAEFGDERGDLVARAQHEHSGRVQIPMIFVAAGGTGEGPALRGSRRRSRRRPRIRGWCSSGSRRRSACHPGRRSPGGRPRASPSPVQSDPVETGPCTRCPSCKTGLRGLSLRRRPSHLLRPQRPPSARRRGWQELGSTAPG